MRYLALLALSLLTSCAYYKERRFPNFDACLAAGATEPEPCMLMETEIPPDGPAAVVYACLAGDFPPSTNQRAQAENLRDEVEKRGLAPDIMVFVPNGDAYVGSTSTYVGYGVAFSQPAYRPQSYVRCLRLAPSRTGIKLDANMMVTSVSDGARKCGIIEGDTLLSVDGLLVQRPGQDRLSEFEVYRMRLHPGMQVRVVWIRPGTGRMDGMLTMEPNLAWVAPKSELLVTPRRAPGYETADT